MHRAEVRRGRPTGLTCQREDFQECRYGPARSSASQDAALSPGGPVPQQPIQGVSISLEAEVGPECWFCWDSCTQLRDFQLIIPLNFQTEFCPGQIKFTAQYLNIVLFLPEQGTSLPSLFHTFPLNHHNLIVNKENIGFFWYFSTRVSCLHQHNLLYERHRPLQSAA